MTKLFRTLVVSALILLVVAALLPFSDPAPVKISLNQPLPVWAIGTMAIFPVALALLVAAWGLFTFKRWGRWLGLLAALAGVAIAFFVTGSPMATGLSSAAVVLLVLSALAWFIGLAVSYHPSVLAKFRHVL